MCVLSYYTYAKTKTGRVRYSRPHPLTFHIHTPITLLVLYYTYSQNGAIAMSLVRRSGDTARVDRERGTLRPEHRAATTLG